MTREPTAILGLAVYEQSSEDPSWEARDTVL